MPHDTIESSNTIKFINRELSWLDFNQRVLDEARNESVPLLDRLKFLAITSSNLDEFFMVRVGGLLMMDEVKSQKADPARMNAAQQLAAISQRTAAMASSQYRVFRDTLEPALEEIGIVRRHPSDLDQRQQLWLEQVFRDQISSVVSPIAIDEEKPFPLLTNRSLYVAVRLLNDSQEDRIAIFCCTTPLKRFLTLPSGGDYQYILLEEVIGLLAENYFPGEKIVESVTFRITRNADLSVREDMAGDLLVGMSRVLAERKQSACVRLEIAEECSDQLLQYLQSTLEVKSEFVFKCGGPVDLSAFMTLAGMPGFDKNVAPNWEPVPLLDAEPRASMFDTIRQGDVLLYHPYESFDPVVRLIEEAADDPDVLAIKQTLYRTSKKSPIVAALTRAAENGKKVTVIVELKARFDEARNIAWAKNLEQASAEVIYGVKGLKTHAKICIIIRRERGAIRKYVHFGTGNYNESTAHLYSNVSYMTRNEELGAEATSFFNAVTGFTQPPRYLKLEAAPIGLRDKVLELIEAETQRVRQGQPGRIAAKLNSLVDPPIIEALYRASAAGVTIDLNIRGICCLRPQVPGLSENIRVVSIVDRFLEHARIIYFHHGGDDLVYISSADWMPRNLDRRVELLVPIEDAGARKRLISILETHFRDNVKARWLTANGDYGPAENADSEEAFRSQEELFIAQQELLQRARKHRPDMFEPHRASGQDS